MAGLLVAALAVSVAWAGAGAPSLVATFHALGGGRRPGTVLDVVLVAAALEAVAGVALGGALVVGARRWRVAAGAWAAATVVMLASCAAALSR